VPETQTSIKQSTALTGEDIFAYSKWSRDLPNLKNRYQQATPFPHMITDHFLKEDTLRKGLAEFPAFGSKDWIHYVHFNERKYGKTDRQSFSPTLGAIVDELNSPLFVRFLTDLTGIQGLFADESLEGGGLHQTGRGGYLNIHADFTVHPHHRKWRRRVNLLVYLNPHWSDSYGGHLELWSQDMKSRVHKVLPTFNRAVIFNTEHDSFHGHPEPLQCPDTASRKSIALYYFTKETSPMIQSTEYRARPTDGSKRILIYLDKMILRIYDGVKRFFKLDDKYASNTLRSLDRVKQKMGRK